MTDIAMNSQRVFKKSSPNNRLTLYLSSRDLVVENGTIDKIQGVLHVDPEHLEPNKKLFAQVTLTFRYGREDEEVMGLKFCNEAIMSLAQIWPPHCMHDRDPNTPLQTWKDVKKKARHENAASSLASSQTGNNVPIPIVSDTTKKVLSTIGMECSVGIGPGESPIGTSNQDALIKRLGGNAYPFHLELTPLAPPSVQLVPAKQYHGAPIGTSYDVRAYIAERADEKASRRNTVRMGIRVVQGPGRPATLPPAPPPTQSHQVLGALAHHHVLRSKKTKSRVDGEDNTCKNKNEEIENEEPVAPRVAVEKPFLLSDGRVELEAWLDKASYSHGESIEVTVSVANHSSKTVKRIKALVVQHVDVCMFSNGKFKNVVALVKGAGTPVLPGQSLTDTYTLTPHRGFTKNWIALEDSYSKSGASLASTVLCYNNTPEERNVFAIYVSYYVKVKLSVSPIAGEVSVKLPFTLTHSCINEAPTDSVIEEATHKMILEGKENSDEEDDENDQQNNNGDDDNPDFNKPDEPNTPEEQHCITNVLVTVENVNDKPKKIEGETEVRNMKPNDEDLDLIEKCPVSDS